MQWTGACSCGMFVAVNLTRRIMKKIIVILILGFCRPEADAQNALPAPSLQLVTSEADTPATVLKWKAASDHVVGFVIEKKEGSRPWLIVAQADPHERTYVDREAATPGTCYRVRAFGVRVLSQYSNTSVSGRRGKADRAKS
jgi:hypothetical protein